MQTRCVLGFPLCGYQNFCFLPQKLVFFAQKQPNLAQNMYFWSFWSKYWHVWPIWFNARPKTYPNKVPRCFFRYVGTFAPVKSRTQKRPNLAFLVIFGQALPAHLVPCWWVGWWLWRSGCISQDIYLIYSYPFSSQAKVKFHDSDKKPNQFEMVRTE